jgi:arylsulfatase A-like enzyme
MTAVRTSQWKYVTYSDEGVNKREGYRLCDELYNLQDDPKELFNLVNDRDSTTVLGEMKQELQRLKDQTGYRLPLNEQSG